MILSPEEAKTKWCPHARIAKGEASTNRSEEWDHDAMNYVTAPDSGAYCLADRCMAWRWAKDRSPEEVEQRNSWMNGQAKPPAGYCGA